jgi:uncharacterized iron-regulated membrane protein
MEKTALYRMIWRWHFYAALFAMPFVIILSLTGAFYLFKPQVERWEERNYAGLPITDAVLPVAQVETALAAFPGAAFHSYRLPEHSGDAAMVHLALADGRTMRDVFVSPQGNILGSVDPEMRTMAIVQRIHGQLMLGPKGSWIVELAASWAIVLVLSGLYLWWPRDRHLAGVLWPRLRLGRRQAWRDLHAVTGFWISGLVLVLLFTGLPWSAAWGGALKAVRAELGWTKGQQDWSIGGVPPRGTSPTQDAFPSIHADHDHDAMMNHAIMDHMAMDHGSMHHQSSPAFDKLSEIVAKAESENLAFPVIVTPPGKPQRFGAKASHIWTVRSDSQNRPLRTVLQYDADTGTLVSRETFDDKHIIDRIVGYGIAWHEGQLFGWVNQLIGVLTAVGLMTIVVSGFIMWRKRKPAGALGAPVAFPDPARAPGLIAILLVLAIVLPLLTLSLVAVFLFEKLMLPHLPSFSRWLGVTSREATSS